MLNNPLALLVLADGCVIEGYSIGSNGFGSGELVFNTSMTGYQEMISDPSYANQIITLTTAHVGSCGCNNFDMESNRVWASGVVVRDASILHSNFRATLSFSDWLKKYNVVAIAGVDTRALTRKLRDNGAIGACITTNIYEKDKALKIAKSAAKLAGGDLARVVTRLAIEHGYDYLDEEQWSKPKKPLKYHVVVYDFGVKESILKILYNLGCHLTIVPAQTKAMDALALNPDGIFLSNGPGDPKSCTYAIDAIKEFLKNNLPIFGICLGFQLLGLANGAKTFKMKFGHHGSNHPVVETQGLKRVLITSQNHGFAIDEDSLPNCLEITHKSLFDNTLQGIKHKIKPAFGFQGHPEASPGPHDLEFIFEQFIDSMSYYKSSIIKE